MRDESHSSNSNFQLISRGPEYQTYTIPDSFIQNRPNNRRNALHPPHSQHLPHNKRDQDTSLTFPRRRRAPRLRTHRPLPLPHRSPRSRSRETRHRPAKGCCARDAVHGHTADHYQHGDRLLGPYAACAGEAFGVEFGCEGQG